MKTVEPVPGLTTIGVVAKNLGVPVHSVAYVLRTRPYIRPVARAGCLRLFDTEAVAQIRHELTAIAARRGGDDA